MHNRYGFPFNTNNIIILFGCNFLSVFSQRIHITSQLSFFVALICDLWVTLNSIKQLIVLALLKYEPNNFAVKKNSNFNETETFRRSRSARTLFTLLISLAQFLLARIREARIYLVLYCKLQLCEGSFINDITIYGERVNDIVTMTM